MASDVYQLRVTLNDAVPAIRRLILVPGDISLRYLHYLLQGAMGWQDSHLYEFAAATEQYGEIDDDAPASLKDASAVLLHQLAPIAGGELESLYDFGDGWTHSVRVEAILPPESVTDCPACIAGERACPPEDFGGAFLYSLWLRKMAGGDLDQDDLDALEEYPGFDFDPQDFSPKTATRRMKRVATNRRYRTWG